MQTKVFNTEDCVAGVWTDDKGPQNRYGRDGNKEHQSQPPPRFHSLQSVGQSLEVEQERPLDREDGRPRKKLGRDGIFSRPLDCLEEVGWRSNFSLADCNTLVHDYHEAVEEPTSGYEGSHGEEKEVVIGIDELEMMDPNEGSCRRGDHGNAQESPGRCL